MFSVQQAARWLAKRHCDKNEERIVIRGSMSSCTPKRIHIRIEKIWSLTLINYLKYNPLTKTYDVTEQIDLIWSKNGNNTQGNFSSNSIIAMDPCALCVCAWQRIVFLCMQNINNIVSLVDNKRKIKTQDEKKTTQKTYSCSWIYMRWLGRWAWGMSISSSPFPFHFVWVFLCSIFQHHIQRSEAETHKQKRANRDIFQALKCSMEWEMSLKCIHPPICTSNKNLEVSAKKKRNINTHIHTHFALHDINTRVDFCSELRHREAAFLSLFLWRVFDECACNSYLTQWPIYLNKLFFAATTAVRFLTVNYISGKKRDTVIKMLQGNANIFAI